MKIIGIGNALVDILAILPDDTLLSQLGLRRGGMELIDDIHQRQITACLAPLHPQMASGGSASNAILALAKLGAEPGFIGRIGSDEMGQFFLQHCKACGIDVRLAIGPGASGVANTFISPDGERTFATHLGESGLMVPDDITAETLAGYDLLHIEGYLVQNHALIEHVAQLAKAQGMKVSIDLASYNVVQADLAFFRHLVNDYVDIVFANEEESAAFTEGKAPQEALQEIASMCETAIVKLGARGSSAMRGNEMVRVNCVPVEKVVDTTAAGDFFAGGFLYAYSQGRSLKECLDTGSLLSSKVIQVVGTQVGELKIES